MANTRAFYEQTTYNALTANAPEGIQEVLRAEEQYVRDTRTPTGRILEVGCGNGRLLEHLATIENFTVGIDFSDAQIQAARKREPRLATLGIQDVKALQFHDNYFNQVYCMNNTLGNIEEGQTIAIAEMIRVLKPGGELHLSMLTPKAEQAQVAMYNAAGLTIAVNGDLGNWREGIILEEGLFSQRYTKSEIKRLFRWNPNPDAKKAGLKFATKEPNRFMHFVIARKPLSSAES